MVSVYDLVEMNDNLVNEFIYWAKERHSIHLKREAGKPKPWTKDPILQRYFFTNPYRENDKTTVWFRETVRDPIAAKPQVFFSTVCFRWFNYIPTGQVLHDLQLLYAWDCELAIAKLNDILRSGRKVFTGAFTISPSGSTKPKIQRVCEDYIQPVWDDLSSIVGQLYKADTLKRAWQVVSSLPGMAGGGFMAYEVVSDLRYTEFLRNAEDINLWANPGPGAKRGLNRLMMREIKSPINQPLWEDQTQELLKIVNKRLPKNMPRFEMREIEHSLCEFDKYLRARTKSGRMKRKYDGV